MFFKLTSQTWLYFWRKNKSSEKKFSRRNSRDNEMQPQNELRLHKFYLSFCCACTYSFCVQAHVRFVVVDFFILFNPTKFITVIIVQKWVIKYGHLQNYNSIVVMCVCVRCLRRLWRRRRHVLCATDSITNEWIDAGVRKEETNSKREAYH